MSFRNAFEEPSGGSGPHTILSATHTDTDTTKAPVGGDVFKFVGGLWVPGRVAWGEVQSKPATFPPDVHGHANATTTADGFMAGADKAKSDEFVGVARGAFSAYKSVNQNDIADLTDVKVTFDTEEWDQAGWYDPTTSRYTPAKIGLYSFTICITISPTVDQRRIAAKLFRRNSAGTLTGEKYFLQAQTSGATALIASGDAALPIQNIGDYFEFYVNHNFGVNTSDILASSGFCFVQGIYEGVL